MPRIARYIHDERAWHLMPILHDALLDAGCDDEDILAHCRGLERCPKCLGEGEFDPYPNPTSSPAERPIHCNFCNGGWRQLSGPHIRGCWVLDLILRKQ